MALFNRLESIFGKKWNDQFSTEQRLESAMSEWGIGLYGLTGDQIKRGIDKTRLECKWPPSIAEFVQFAKGQDESWEHRGAAYQVAPKALPKPKTDPEKVRSNLQAMRGALS